MPIGSRPSMRRLGACAIHCERQIPGDLGRHGSHRRRVPIDRGGFWTRRIGSFRTDGSAQIVAFTQLGNDVVWVAFDAATQSKMLAVSLYISVNGKFAAGQTACSRGPTPAELCIHSLQRRSFSRWQRRLPIIDCLNPSSRIGGF
jgi:hypothetical protein